MPTDEKVSIQFKKCDFRTQVYHKLRNLGYTGKDAQKMVDKLKELMEEFDDNR